jgi:uncharacterized protein with HEPN domain
MAGRNVRARIYDIRQELGFIRELLTDGMTAGELKADGIKRRALERSLEIISEACRHVPDEITARYDAIPWRQIRDLGNVVRHDYQRIDTAIIWEIVTLHIDRLEAVVEEIDASISATESKPDDNGET